MSRPGVPLELDAEEFRRLGHRLVDRIAEHLATLADRPLTTGQGPAEIRRLIAADRTLPEDGAPAAALLEHASEALFGHSLFNGHPRFWGYITSSPAPLGMLADLLASAVNANVGAWKLSPVATEIEAQTVRWIGELIGFPAGAGLLVSGGNVANLACFLAARAAHGGDALRREGVAPARGLRVYASEETHTWLQKAADISGLGTDAIRFLPTDDALRLRMDALRGAIADDRARGLRPFLVVGTAGSVSTGAVDPLAEIARVCREERLWFHVDGAYGSLAAAAAECPADLRAQSEADSVAVDPHKWLYAPLEAGCALVRHPAALGRAFAYHPAYYHFGEEATNYFDQGPQNSRGFRALKVWLQLQQAGRKGYARMIGDDIRLAGELHAAVSRHPELEALTLALSIATFRYVPPGLRATLGSAETGARLEAINRAILEKMERGGEAFVSNAVIRGRFALRACIVNFNTRASDVAALPDLVVRLGREVAAT
jgi:glutamate/tyrosine decarboxylase-like PLP-dependent enzyme